MPGLAFQHKLNRPCKQKICWVRTVKLETLLFAEMILFTRGSELKFKYMPCPKVHLIPNIEFNIKGSTAHWN